MNKKNFQIIKYCIFLKYSPQSQLNHFITSFINHYIPIKTTLSQQQYGKGDICTLGVSNVYLLYILFIIIYHNLYN